MDCKGLAQLAQKCCIWAAALTLTTLCAQATAIMATALTAPSDKAQWNEDKTMALVNFLLEHMSEISDAGMYKMEMFNAAAGNIAVHHSVGEVWFGSVWGTFCQTGNQTVRFFLDFQKPKPKPHQTVWCGFKWFQTRFKPKPFKKKIICNNLFTLHNFVVYLLQIYLIHTKLHTDGCPEEKR